MELKVKKLHPDAVIPGYSKPGDAGLDLVAVTKPIFSDRYVEYGTGLAFEIPEGYVGLIFPRSSISSTSLVLSNSAGVIDSGFRGEVKFRFRLSKRYPLQTEVFYQKGDRIGQLVVIPYPTIALVEVPELSQTDRGQGGFGSTGK